MSGSEGKQNSQLSVREMEEEEMAQELMNMEMYEVGMDFDQMKQLLWFINESKNMAGIEPQNRSSQETTQYSEEIRTEEIAKNNSLRELISEENSLPKPSYSYRQQSGKASPPTSGRKSAPEVHLDEEMSLDSPDMFDNQEPKTLSADGESVVDKLVKEKETEIDKNESSNESISQIRSKNPWKIIVSDSSQHSESGEAKIEDNKSRKNQRIERWKLDPTNSVVEENDVPLKERRRYLLKERPPYSFCHNRRLFEANINKKVLTVLSHTLGEVADIWRSKDTPDVSEFQWGSPIKVGANSRGLDKKPVIEDADSPERRKYVRNNPASIQRRNMDRNCKRKAVEHIRVLINDEVESDGSSDSIFEIVKKPKIRADKERQPQNNSEKVLTRRDKIFNNMRKPSKPEEWTMTADYDSDEFDNDDLNNLRKKNLMKKNEEAARASSSEEFPRRIVPPNPIKPKTVRRPGGNRDKGKTAVKKNTQAVLEKNEDSEIFLFKTRDRNAVAKQQMNRQLELNDEITISHESESNEPEEIDLEIEIHPQPVKGLAHKLRLGKMHLLQSKEAEERLKQAKINEKINAENEEKNRKRDIWIQRNREKKKEREEREAKEHEIKVKEEIWKRNQAARDRERREREAREKTRSQDAAASVLLMDEEDDNVDSFIRNIDAKQKRMEKLVRCPICNLEFSANEIANHAADCNQFDNPDEPGTSRSPIDNDDLGVGDDLPITDDPLTLSCSICSRFTTTNGIVFEEHMNSCIKRSNGQTNKHKQSDLGTQMVIVVPDSPERSFKPISKQSDSEIDYTDQFTARRIKPNIKGKTKKKTVANFECKKSKTLL